MLIQKTEKGCFDLSAGNISIRGLRFGAVYVKGKCKSGEQIHTSFLAGQAENGDYTGDDGIIRMTLRIKATDGGEAEIGAFVENISGADIRLWSVNLLEGEDQGGGMVCLEGCIEAYRFFSYLNGGDGKVSSLNGCTKPYRITPTGSSTPADLVYDRENWHISWDFGGIFHVASQAGLFAGFTGPGYAFGDICVKAQPGEGGFYLRSRMDGVLVEPGETRQSETAVLFVGKPIETSCQWAKSAAEAMGGVRLSRPFSGWCSWYTLGENVSEADVDHAIREYAQLPVKTDVLQIDGGYEKCWGDWEANERFPSGMKAVSDKIRAAGFMPGIYLAPTAADVKSSAYRNHPEWFQWLDDGSPANTMFDGQRVHFDPTHPDVKAFIFDTAHKQAFDWGFDYIKYDFTYTLELNSGLEFYDPKATIFQIQRETYRLIREAIGNDKYLLACVGEPGRYAIGYADAARIGPDTIPTWPYTKDAIQNAILSMNVNSRWFAGDPDVFHLRAEGIELTKEERQLTAAVAMLYDGLVLTSDFPMQWDEETRQIALKTLKHPSWDALPLSLPADGFPEILAAPNIDGIIVALLNWGEEAQDLVIDFELLGMDLAHPYEVSLYWGGEPCGRHSRTFTSYAQPPHSARVYQINPGALCGDKV